MAELRGQAAPLVYVDAGNHLFEPVAGSAADPEAARRRARLLARVAVHLEAAAVNVGARDLGEGLEFLLGLGQEEGVPWVSTNLRRSDGTHPFPRWRAISAGGVTLTVVGVAAAVPGAEGSGLIAGDPAEALREVWPRLPAADAVVCLSDLGPPGERRLAQAVPELFAVVGGGAPEPLHEPLRLGSTLVLQAADRGRYLGVLDLRSPQPVTGGVQAAGHRVIGLGPAVGGDPLVERWADDHLVWEAGHQARRRAAPGGSVRPPPASFLGSGSCRGCHAQAYRHWLSTPHSRTYAVLGSQGGDPRCLECHAVELQSAAGTAREPAVGCEACHGPGSTHRGGAVRPPSPSEAVCRTCHRGFHPEETFAFESDRERIRCREEGPSRGGAH